MTRIAMIFPGQASQAVGMARDLTTRAGPAADFLSRVNDWLGEDLTRLMYEGPLETLTETRYAQPAILAHSVTVALALRDLGVEPSVVAGHSLGEFSAAVVAGALAPENGLRLVQRRGQLMFEAGQEQPGTMAAVLGLTVDEVSAVCARVSEREGTVCLANHNSPAQVVISGEAAAVAAASQALKAAGARKVVELQVSGAFHSPLLTDAANRFATYLAEFEVNDPAVPIVVNVSAQAVHKAEVLKAGFAKQLTAPVLWHDSLQKIMAGDDLWPRPHVVLEVGPGRVLSNLAKRIYPEVAFHAIGTATDLDNVMDLLSSQRP